MIETQRVIDAARSHIGTPYCDRAHQRGVAADCFGLIMLVAEDVDAVVPNMDLHLWPSMQDVLDGFPKWMDRVGGPRAGALAVISPGRATAARPRIHYGILTDATRHQPMGLVHSARGLQSVQEVAWSSAWSRRAQAFFMLRRPT